MSTNAKYDCPMCHGENKLYVATGPRIESWVAVPAFGAFVIIFITLIDSCDRRAAHAVPEMSPLQQCAQSCSDRFKSWTDRREGWTEHTPAGQADNNHPPEPPRCECYALPAVRETKAIEVQQGAPHDQR